jgi:hypothetical protein
LDISDLLPHLRILPVVSAHFIYSALKKRWGRAIILVAISLDRRHAAFVSGRLRVETGTGAWPGDGNPAGKTQKPEESPCGFRLFQLHFAARMIIEGSNSG